MTAVPGIPLGPLSVLLLAAGGLLVGVSSLVVAYLLAGAVLDLLTPS